MRLVAEAGAALAVAALAHVALLATFTDRSGMEGAGGGGEAAILMTIEPSSGALAAAVAARMAPPPAPVMPTAAVPHVPEAMELAAMHPPPARTATVRDRPRQVAPPAATTALPRPKPPAALAAPPRIAMPTPLAAAPAPSAAPSAPASASDGRAAMTAPAAPPAPGAPALPPGGHGITAPEPPARVQKTSTLAPEESRRPPPRPERARPGAAAQPALAQQAQGQPGGQTAGARGSAEAASAARGAGSPEAMARWGGQIRARVERARRHPGIGSGTAIVAFSVSREGALLEARLAQSSGNAALDRAALDAVRRAAPFPAAPPEVSGARAAFNLPVAFRR